jgi:AcrR family transcriptional regulator
MPDRRPARDVTRARLLATAEQMFFDRGYSTTSVEAIAAEAGFTTGAIYSNFGGKADLFLAVLDQVTSAELTVVRRALASATTDEQRLDVFTKEVAANGERFRARVAATLEFLAVVRHDAELQSRVLAAQQLADETLGEMVSALCRSLGLEEPRSAQELAIDVNALLNGLAIRSLFDADLDLPRAIASGINRLLTGEGSVVEEASAHAR